MQRFGSTIALLDRKTRAFIAVAVVTTVATFVLRAAGASEVTVFAVSAVALGSLASVVGDATDELGNRMGAGATGVLQSALGNLPELFISLFALQAGLVVVVQYALVGSILANSLLVLGFAFILGGIRHGTQHFSAHYTRSVSTLLVLAVAAMLIPTLATAPGAPDEGHAADLSLVCAIVLLVVFIGSIPLSLSLKPEPELESPEISAWPLRLAIGILTVAAITAAFVADWFVEALRPAMATLGISEEFAGLVIVAIAGNAVEHIVGVQMAMKNKADLAMSLIQNSSLQVALALTPALVIASLFIGPTPLTLVLTPLLVASLGLAAILGALVVTDGESNWLEGLALVGLYIIIAASVWWGHPIAA